MDMILETADLCKSFKNQIAVNNISLHIKRNSVYGLLGPNGACENLKARTLALCLPAFRIDEVLEMVQLQNTGKKKTRLGNTRDCVRQSRSFLWRVGSKADTGYPLPLLRDAPRGGEETF